MQQNFAHHDMVQLLLQHNNYYYMLMHEISLQFSIVPSELVLAISPTYLTEI